MTEGETLATGPQYEIGFGDHHAVITGVGATLRTCALHRRDVIRSFPAEARSPAGHGQVLAPWPNRLQGGRYQWEGQTLQLPLSEPARGNAIHGLVRWQEWEPAERRADGVRLHHRIHPQDGYPFLVDVEVDYSLSETGLMVRATAANPGTNAAPFGIGFHPYLMLGDGPVDRWTLAVPAARRLVTDDNGIPTSSESVEGTELDFRGGRAIGDLVLDAAFTDLVRDGAGRAVASIGSGRGGEGDGVSLWVDGSFSALMVFTGDTLGPGLRRRAVAVEPMTCPPNALASGAGIIVLPPGDRWDGCWGISSEAEHGPHR
jgi:aldose 1-epimerase